MQRDVLIFTAEDSGNFAMKGFKRINRHEGVQRSWARCIWNRTLPPNIAAFMWKVIRHAIPVDSRIKTKGIIMASRCHCCSMYDVETTSHLFLHSEITKAVWQCFG